MVKNRPIDRVNFDNVESSAVYHLNEKRRIEVRIINLNGIKHIDIRNWERWHQDEDWHPTKKGIFLEFRVFNEHVLPIINEVTSK